MARIPDSFFDDDKPQEEKRIPDEFFNDDFVKNQENPGFFKRVGGDILAGMAEGGQSLNNLRYSLNKGLFGQKFADMAAAPPDPNATGINKILTHLGTPKKENIDYSAEFGVPQPNLADRLLKGAISFVPSAMLGSVTGGSGYAGLGIGGGLYGLSGSEPNASPMRTGADVATGAASGLISKPIGDALGSILHSAGYLLGNKTSISKAGNALLEHIRGQSMKGGAFPPSEVAENYGKFVDERGVPLPVDIGTLSGNGAAKLAYGASKSIPFTGAAEKLNMVKSGVQNKEISDVRSMLEDVNNPVSPNEETYIKGKLGQLSEPTEQYKSIQNKLPSVINEKNLSQNVLDESNDKLNELMSGAPDRASPGKYMKGGVTDAYKEQKEVANKKYEPINNASEMRLDVESSPDGGKLNSEEQLYPKFSDKSKELLKYRDNLKDIFGTSDDLGKSINSELNKIENPTLDSNEKFPTLGNARTRIQSLGQLSAAAHASGARNESRILSSMRDALSDDVDGILKKSGNEGLANSLKDANQHYKENVIPFWKSNVIRKSVEDPSYIPKPEILSKELHDQNNLSIMNKLKPDIKNASLYHMITKGKGSSSGMANMSPSDIAKSYNRIKSEEKNVISSYTPDLDKYFESLSGHLSNVKKLSGQESALTKNMSNIDKSNSSQANLLNQKLEQQSKLRADNSERLNKLLEDMRAKRLSNSNYHTPIPNSISAGLGGALGSGLLKAGLGKAALLFPPSVLLGRSTANLLTNPDLIKAYINNTSLPVRNQIINPLINRLSPAATPAIMSIIQSLTGNSR